MGVRVQGSFDEAWKAFSRTNQDALPFLIADFERQRPPLRDVLVARLRPILPGKIAAWLPARDYPVDFRKSLRFVHDKHGWAICPRSGAALINALTDNQTRIRRAAADALAK